MDRSSELDAMRRAVVLSSRALGRTSPNPPVGAVVLSPDAAVVGEGWTSPPGGPHAEVVALRAAGDRARGGTAVVTLEPCRHFGRTGPCTSALIAAGIARVVVACADPTEQAGGGADVLRAAGLEVETGVLADEVALGPLEAWLTSRRTGRPFVTWKYAATLDGRSAAADGTSRWITGEQSRADVHRLRAQADAVVAGVGTVLADDPQLDVRGVEVLRQPLRVVVDSTGRTPTTARVLQGPSPALVVTGPLADDPGLPLRREVGTDAAGRLDLRELLGVLQDEHDVVSVLLEGGPTLAGAFVAEGLVDRVVAYLAPALLGSGPAALGAAGVGTISAAHRLQVHDVTRTGEDLRLTLRRRTLQPRERVTQMFTGIVEELGEVVAIEVLADASRLTVRGPVVTSDAGHGDSIAVNGVCLTVVETADGAFTADVMAESLKRSSLGALQVGSPVNLERAVRVSDRLGGHVVQGHVDGTGQVLAVTPDEHWTVVRTSLPDGLGRYVVEKGSITVDGVSLTVSALAADWFEVSLIPTTLSATTLGRKAAGDPVNLEVDVLAKHVEKLLQAGIAPGRTERTS